MADDKTFTKAELDAAVTAAVEKEVGGLKDKRDELIEEVKNLKTEMRKSTGVKPEDLAALETENEQLKVKLVTAEKQAKEHLTAKEKAEGALKAEQSVTYKLVAENGLREQLVTAGITNPAYQKAAIAMLSPQVQVSAEGEARVAKVGDKALADFVKEWAGSDEGKTFVAAPNNTGGGAPGGKDGKAAAQTMTRSEYNALDQQSQGEAGLRMAKGELKVVDEAA